MKKTIGVLAHVDAGKTTFSEQVLYRTHAIRSLGRVDHSDAFLDLHAVERERGITVFSEQAVFDIGENRYFWLDTPGHVDFSAEMERVLPVLDYAVLIISCVDGVESHTETVWELLRRYSIPVMVFVNKTDRTEADFLSCISEMKRRLSRDITDLTGFDGRKFDEASREAVAETDEKLLDMLMEDRFDFDLWRNAACAALRERRFFPVFRGSALQGDGMDGFLAAMDALTDTDYREKEKLPFSADVYKIRHDNQGLRLVYAKLRQGHLRVRDELASHGSAFKVNEIRMVHGGKFRSVDEAAAGDIVCIPGLAGIRIGDCLGDESGRRDSHRPEPMLRVSVSAPAEIPRTKLLSSLRILEEEDPVLAVEYNERAGEISLRVMGRIQTEILGRMVKDRFGIEIEFGAPQVMYTETIAESVIGIGHYEPLRHYAEVWLRLVPTQRGSGITFATCCHVDSLALNWQRLIETHVFEKTHCGVLTGAPLTDVRIELIAGRAHLKHTEGGDFRESTYRAIRNGLMNAKSVLLEPVCRFSMRFPSEVYGRVMADVTRMSADNIEINNMGDWTSIEGECTLRRIADYPDEFRMLTHGRGGLTFRFSRYMPAQDAEKIIEEKSYNPLAEDTPDSVFCSHGAGYNVPWNEVCAHAHCEVEEV